jgi:ATP-binding cassette subfamily B (MDR/TAP) protein 1
MWWSRKGPNGSTAALPQHAQQQREQEDSAPNNAVDPPGQAAASVTKEHPPVPYWKLFSCADRLDVVLIVLGVLGALANGAALPIFSLFFGDFVNAFGAYIPPCLLHPGALMPPGLLPTSGFRHLIQKIALKFVYLAIGAAVAGTLQQGCLQLSSTRMVCERLLSCFA